MKSYKKPIQMLGVCDICDLAVYSYDSSVGGLLWVRHLACHKENAKEEVKDLLHTSRKFFNPLIPNGDNNK